jgi:cupin 2 domain-containing protein
MPLSAPLGIPGSLAQSVEHRTFNPLVDGSNPSRPTIPFPCHRPRGRAAALGAGMESGHDFIGYHCSDIRPKAMHMQTGNLLAGATAPGQGERFDTLLAHRNLVIERIISSAVVSPQEYVQTQDEWVVLLQGEATLEVAGDLIDLRAGDHAFLPAGTPHTVRRVSQGALWLAVHLH